VSVCRCTTIFHLNRGMLSHSSAVPARGGPDLAGERFPERRLPRGASALVRLLNQKNTPLAGDIASVSSEGNQRPEQSVQLPTCHQNKREV
jgi:hypothetical protein